MKVGVIIVSAEEFLDYPAGTVVRSLDGLNTFGQRDDYELVHEFGTEMSGSVRTWFYPCEVIWLPPEQ